MSRNNIFRIFINKFTAFIDIKISLVRKVRNKFDRTVV
jgi:hypothetical protein